MSILCSLVGASFTVAAAAQVLRQKRGITALGNAQIDTAQSKFGGASAYFDGTGDSIEVGNNSDALILSGDFTIEMWFRVGNQNAYLFTNEKGTVGANKLAVYILPTVGRLDWYLGGTPALNTNASSVVINTWTHIAFVRSSNIVRCYINGVQQTATKEYSADVGNVSTGTDTWYFGGRGAVDPMLGHLDEIRFSNSARYTSNFTPSTTAFVNDANTLLLIHADGTDAQTFFEDDNGVRASVAVYAANQAQISTAQSKFGGSSIVFDGADDYLSIDTVPTVTGDLTYELWGRFDILPWNQTYGGGGWMQIAFDGGSDYLIINRSGSSGSQVMLQVATGGRYGSWTKSGVNLAINTWYHIAFVRSSGVWKTFFNGTELTTFTNDSGFTNSGRTENVRYGRIGMFGDSRGSWDGYMDEIRFSNSARYTADYTPPTAPFVNDANTLLLIHGDGTNGSTVFRDDNGALGSNWTGRRQVPLTIGGNMQISTAESKFGSSSLLSDGVGDYIIADTNVAFGTGALTIEWWCYMTTATDEYIFDCRGSGVELLFIRYSSGRYQFNIGADIGWLSNSGVTIGTNTWIHFALVRQSNGDVKIYRDGVDHNSSGVNQINSGIMNDNTNLASTDFWISANASTLGTNWYGYIDEFRVSNTARYTTTFTPASTAFGNDANTVLLIHGDGANASTTITDDIGTGRTQKGIQALGNAQIDTAQSKFGGASALFDGTGDYLTVSTGTDLTDLTVELWYRAATLPGSGLVPLISFNNTLMYIGYNGANTVYDYYANGSGRVSLNTVAISTGVWYHAAFVRSGSSITIYHNGTSVTTGTFATAVDWGTYSAEIAKYAGYFLNGHIDEVRVSNSARYTANFTPSTTPFQNDANTLLLIHADGTDGSTVFIDDNGIAPYTP